MSTAAAPPQAVEGQQDDTPAQVTVRGATSPTGRLLGEICGLAQSHRHHRGRTLRHRQLPGRSQLPHANYLGWYEPHIAQLTSRSMPSTTLWFWGTEIGWATMHGEIAKGRLGVPGMPRVGQRHGPHRRQRQHQDPPALPRRDGGVRPVRPEGHDPRTGTEGLGPQRMATHRACPCPGPTQPAA